MSYPNLKGDPALLKYKRKDGEIKETEIKAGKHDYKKFFLTLKYVNDYNKTKNNCLNKKNFFTFWTFTRIVLNCAIFNNIHH